MHKSDLSSSLTSLKYKIVLLGDSGVGKSSIIDRFVKAEIDQQHQVTLSTRSPQLASTSSAETSSSQVTPIA